MLKKTLLTLAGILLLVVGGGYLFREQLWETVAAALTEDMFIAADSDAFDPGLPVGSEFPPVRVRYRGETLTDAGRFVHDKGMVFIANRSAVC